MGELLKGVLLPQYFFQFVFCCHIHYLGINLGGADACMAEYFLYYGKGHSLIYQIGGRSVPGGVEREVFTAYPGMIGYRFQYPVGFFIVVLVENHAVLL